MTLSLGIDVGGSGIKAAIVDLATGEFTTERVRVETPQPATPDSVVAATAGLIADLGHNGPIGIGFPSPIVDGVTTLAAGLGAPVRVINDADAAGVAEARYGAAHGVQGLVVLLTLGTGIGSALLYNGVLVPNTEMGHIQVRGKDAEHRAAASVREAHDLSWHHWAERLHEVIEVIDRLFWPDLVLLGGGVSRKADKFLHFIDVRPPLRAAALENRAGIVGAAAAAADRA